MAISYNEVITFGRNGTAKSLNCSGIDFSEGEKESWTYAPVAEMDIQLPPARGEVTLHLEATPYVVPDHVAAQNVFIFLGGLFIGYCTFSDYDTKTFMVLRGAIAGRPNRMSLVIPTAASPASLSSSEDMRALGIRLTSIRFNTAM
jgi:hypothetical protein